jgi:hypothetical protein
MSAARARRIATVVLALLLVVAPVVSLLPGAPGVVRVDGITLLWWYAGLVGPALAATASVVALVLTRA